MIPIITTLELNTHTKNAYIIAAETWTKRENFNYNLLSLLEA